MYSLLSSENFCHFMDNRRMTECIDDSFAQLMIRRFVLRTLDRAVRIGDAIRESIFVKEQCQIYSAQMLQWLYVFVELLFKSFHSPHPRNLFPFYLRFESFFRHFAFLKRPPNLKFDRKSSTIKSNSSYKVTHFNYSDNHFND